MTILALTAALFFSCFAGETGEFESANQSALTDLTEFDQFASAFDAGEGAPRLVLLLSPT